MNTTLQCSGYLPAMTLIHNAFIENHMLSANGSYVKVYLYLSKCIQAGEKNLSISALADKMDNTEKDILRALNYWEKHNLIHLSKDESGITGIELLNLSSTDKVESACTKENTNIDTTEHKEDKSKHSGEDKKTDESKETATKTTEINITLGQTERLSNDEDFLWICRVIESYVNRPLSPKDMQLISYIYDNLGFSSDLLLYLYEYCICIGKANINYIQAVALSWHEKDIKTPEEAEKFSSAYNSAYIAVSKAFGFERRLGTIEKQLISHWLDEWNMDLAVVLEACNRTMLKFQTANWNYTKKIITQWHNNNIHTLQDVEKADEAYTKTKPVYPDRKTIADTQNTFKSQNQFDKFQQREVSQEELDELERKLLAL